MSDDAKKAKKDLLTRIKNDLTSLDTAISYKLESHSHIKGTYELAGVRYAEDADREQALVDDVSQKLKTEVDQMIQDLETEIQRLG